MTLRGLDIVNPLIQQTAEIMIAQYGEDALLRTIDALNNKIDAGDIEGRDFWAQVVNAIHTITPHRA